MKNVFFAIVLLTMITGCNVQKHVSRSQLNASSQTETRDEMASRLNKEIKTDIQSSVDTHTSENCDTNFQTPGSNVTGEKSLEYLLQGGSFELENSAVKGIIRVDTLSGKVTLSIDEKPKIFPHSFNRTTVTHETTNKETNEKEDLKTSAQQKTKTNSDLQSSLVDKQVEKTFNWWWIPIAVCILIIAMFAFRYFYRIGKLKTGK
jgi:hypothetical protein